MSDIRVLVLDDDPPPDLERLRGRAQVVTTDEDRLAELLPSADVVLVWDFASHAVRRAWPGRGRRPGWVHTPSAGVDHVLSPEFAASDTVLTNARGVFDRPIAEYVAGLVLALAKDFPGTWERQRQHRWQHRETLRLAGTRAVVVGAGPIGRAVADTLGCLEVRTELVGRTARAGVRGQEELPALLAQADWVVCAAPLTPQTRGMFGREAFAAMPDRARFINVGRGPLVDTAALVAALEQREIAAAALDVFETEPLPPDDPLWQVPGLFVSPHMSGDTVGWRGALADQFVELFDLWEAGRPLFNIVDKQLGYVR